MKITVDGRPGHTWGWGAPRWEAQSVQAYSGKRGPLVFAGQRKTVVVVFPSKDSSAPRATRNVGRSLGS